MSGNEEIADLPGGDRRMCGTNDTYDLKEKKNV